MERIFVHHSEFSLETPDRAARLLLSCSHDLPRGVGGRIWLLFCRKHCEIWKKGQFKHLRASFCKYRKSGATFKIFIFCPNKAFSELFSKIQLKDRRAFEFFQNRGKFENRQFGLPPPLKIVKNDAFSCRSCW